MLAYVISFIAWYMYNVMTLPKNAAISVEQKKRIIKGFRFMFMRFCPEHWYWGGVLIVRNFLCSLVAFFPADEPFAQLLYLGMVCLVFLVMQVRYWPWVSIELNYVDAAQMVMMVGLMLSALPFVGSQMDSAVREQAGIAMVVFYAGGTLEDLSR